MLHRKVAFIIFYLSFLLIIGQSGCNKKAVIKGIQDTAIPTDSENGTAFIDDTAAAASLDTDSFNETDNLPMGSLVWVKQIGGAGEDTAK